MKKSGEMVLSGQAQHAVGVFMSPGSSLYRKYIKRILDVVFAVALLPLVLPFLAILYVLVRKDGGPFLYSHTRIGKNGKEFGCLKIRTMVVDAEAVLKEMLDRDPALREEWDTHFKLKNDPRITKIGQLLRKTSLDELPQVFNILSGDMSVVGPRPITAEELLLYGDEAEAYKAMRPGLTGPWQITGRRENDFDSRAKLDAEYADTVSFLRDSYIVLMTVPEVLLARGK